MQDRRDSDGDRGGRGWGNRGRDDGGWNRQHQHGHRGDNDVRRGSYDDRHHVGPVKIVYIGKEKGSKKMTITSLGSILTRTTEVVLTRSYFLLPCPNRHLLQLDWFFPLLL